MESASSAEKCPQGTFCICPDTCPELQIMCTKKGHFRYETFSPRSYLPREGRPEAPKPPVGAQNYYTPRAPGAPAQAAGERSRQHAPGDLATILDLLIAQSAKGGDWSESALYQRNGMRRLPPAASAGIGKPRLSRSGFSSRKWVLRFLPPRRC